MNVFAVQLDVVWEDKAANFARVRQLLGRCEVPAGSLIVLPEMFSTGFSMNLAVTRQGDPPEAEEFLAQLARDFDATVMGGVVGGGTGQPRNEAVVLAPDGHLLARFAKIHPFSPGEEQSVYTPGNEIITFEWAGFTVAPFVCYDLRFPEIFRAAVEQGATLFAVIAQWPDRRAAHWSVLQQARAIENQAMVVGVNRSGRDPQHTYLGRSAVVNPLGVITADAGEGEGVLRAQLDPQEVARARAEFPALRDRRWPVR